MSLPFPSITGTFEEPIGVSLDARWARAAQVVMRDGKPVLVGAARLRRAEVGPGDRVAPLTTEEASGLFGALARQGIRSQRVVLAVPCQHAALTPIELPPRSSGAPLEQIAAVELSRLQRLEPGTFEIALWELPRGPKPGRGSAGSYMAATAPHEAGEALSAGFDGTGAMVTALVPEALALAKAAARCPDTRAVLSLTWSAMEIVVLSEDGKIVYHRALPELGLHRVGVVAKERLGLAPEAVDGALEALANGSKAPDGSELPEHLEPLAAGVGRIVQEHADFVAVEVERSLTYSARLAPDCEQKPVRIVGEGAGVPGFLGRLSEQLGLEFLVLSCAELVGVKGEVPRHLAACDLAPAIGAAMWTRLESQGRVA